MRASWFFTLVFGTVACADSAPRATGEVGPWTAAAPLPTARANHCSTAVGDWVVVVGGNHSEMGGFVTTDEIHAAKLVDGVLGEWTLAGKTPSAVTECAATSDGEKLYLLGGIYEEDADRGKLWAASFEDGVLGNFASLGDLPMTSPTSIEASVRGGQLLLTDTHIPTDGDMTRTMKTSLPSLSWTEARWDFGFRAQAQYAFTDDNIYAIGGYRDPSQGTLPGVSIQSISTGEVRSLAPLPVAVGFGEAVAVDDWIFVVGGRSQVFNAPGSSDVYAAQILADGSLETWEPRGGLPMARTNHELALVGDYLVLTGGAAMGPGDATVLISQVRP